MKNELKFLSYDGEYPNLCCGKLKMELNGKVIIFPRYCLSSGGNCYINDDSQEEITTGEWEIIKYPENFPEELKSKATDLVNNNVYHGCCGGCI